MPRWDDMSARSRTAIGFLGIAFVLQWAWETAHSVAYVETKAPLMDRLWHCIPMAFVDAAWSGAIVVFAVCVARWFRRPSLTWGVALLAGAVTAVWVEQVALRSGRWTYNELMPIIPVADVGLWPVAQMSLLPILALLLSAKSARTSNPAPSANS